MIYNIIIKYKNNIKCAVLICITVLVLGDMGLYFV